MLSKMRTNNKGFTLIELMIVIAIIGILAAIAIPNFIAYRNKSFCSAAESDANSIAGGLSDYFAIPTITGVPVQAGVPVINLARTGAPNASVTMSGTNLGTIGGDTDPNNGITITVVDGSGRCPQDYMLNMDSAANPRGFWTAATSTYTKLMD